MDAEQILHDYLYKQPEHPVPFAGDVVHLVYPPTEGGVGVVVNTDKDGTATFTVAVPADLMARSVNDACAAMVREAGGAPGSADAVSDLRRRMGERAFDERVGNMVRLQFLSVAVMRTRVLPFLAPRFLRSGAYREGHPYSFQALVTLRPRAELGDYGFGPLDLPARPQVSDQQVNARINQTLGGDVPWDQVGEAPEGSGLARMRSDVRSQMADENESEWRQRAAEACADQLSSRLTGAPWPRHVEALREAMANSFAADVEQGGQRWEDYVARPEFDMEEFKRHMTEMALQSLRRGMVLDAVASHVGVSLTRDEVRDALSAVARGHEQEAVDGMLRTGQLAQLLEGTLRVKTGEYLVKQVEKANAAAAAGQGAAGSSSASSGPSDEARGE